MRYKEIPEEDSAPIVGTCMGGVQKWFAGENKSIEITINKKDYRAKPRRLVANLCVTKPFQLFPRTECCSC